MKKIVEHYDYIRYGILQKRYSIKNIQYSIIDRKEDTILFIEGTNDRKDWGFNFMYIGLFFHFGWYVLARQLYSLVKNKKNLVIVGHSMGAGVASILYWMVKKDVKDMILLACPSSYTKLNPLIPSRCTSYRTKGDIIGLTKLLGLFRQPKKVTTIPCMETNPIEAHKLSNYLKSIKKIVDIK